MGKWCNLKALLILLLITLLHATHGAGAVSDEDHTINGLYWARNLARKEPVENILFAHVGENTYRCFKMDGSVASWKAVIYHVPFNIPIATYTLYESAAQNLIDGLDYADSISLDSCRYPYVVCKPLIILSLRINEPEKRMRFYRILPTETDEWREYLPAFLTVASASDGTLTFDWRLVYQVAFSKESSSSPVHQAMDYLDGYTDDKRMAKQYLGVDYLGSLLDDWYRDNPYLAPHDWYEEYQKTLKKKEYYSSLGEIETGLYGVNHQRK